MPCSAICVLCTSIARFFARWQLIFTPYNPKIYIMIRIRHCAAAFAALLSGTVVAAPVYQPPGPTLTYGDVAFGPRASSAMGNPAAGALDLDRRGGETKTTTGLSISAGIEWGNVDDILELINEVAGDIEPSDPDDGGGEPPPGGDPGDKPPDGGIDLPIDPDAEELIKDITREVVKKGAILALLQAEGYAKAFAATDIPIVLGKEHLGGAWAFGINLSGTSTAFGFAESIEFDTDVALEDARTILDDIENDNVQPEYYIGGDDVLVLVNTETDNVKLRFDNDSALVTKAAVIGEFSASYSREMWSGPAGKLYGGIEAKFYRVGLSRVATRFGDITDSEELWKSIKDADFNYSNNIGADLGVVWSGANYQLGATITDINEPDFQFPEIDSSNFKDAGVRALIESGRDYVMERQLKLEGSWFSPNRRWGVNLGIDANDVPDPLGYKYQWATLSAGYSTDSFWLPGVRFGVRKNLVGTRIGYLGVGVTAFKYLNLDIASSLETTSIDGTELPRSLLINLGFNVAF